jgi:hypothetical protein
VCVGSQSVDEGYALCVTRMHVYLTGVQFDLEVTIVAVQVVDFSDTHIHRYSRTRHTYITHRHLCP